MKKIMYVVILLAGNSLMQAFPFVTTFINTTNINIDLELHFSDNSMVTKGIAMAQSYQVVNFDTKMITSVIFNSSEKDKNGNLYGQLDKKFIASTADITYSIALQAVPAHQVPAGPGTDAFQMPDSQKIVCDIPSVLAEKLKEASVVSTPTIATNASTSPMSATAVNQAPVAITAPAVKK